MKVNDTRGPALDVATNRASPARAATVGDAPTDRVSVNRTMQALAPKVQALRAEAQGELEASPERVEQVKRAVAAGQFPINVRRLAEAILEEAR